MNLRELAEKASGGEWKRSTEGHSEIGDIEVRIARSLRRSANTDATWVLNEEGKIVAFVGNGPHQVENGAWIAAANPARILALLAAGEAAVLRAFINASVAHLHHDGRGGFAECSARICEETVRAEAAWREALEVEP